MRVSEQGVIRSKAMANLMLAQERLAKEGTASEVIRLTSFILRQSKKFGDVFVNVGAECDEQGRDE